MQDSHLTTLPDGRELGWLELGEPTGPPVFAFHGTPGSRLQFTIGDDAMRAAGGRVVCVDRPGYALSTFQPGRRLLDWPHDVSWLADHLGIERFAVLGVSGGGPHASVCAATLKDRVTSAAIVSGVGPLYDPAATEGMMKSNQLFGALARRRSPLLRAIVSTQSAIVRRQPLRALDLMSRQLPPADVALLHRPDVRDLFVRDIRSGSATTARAMVQDFELFATDWGFELSSITVPVHLWQGDADVNVPPSHATLQHERIPGSTLHWLPGEGHLYCVDHFGEIVETLLAA
jgi:pimeloyl-ACP methyl ester carboxylesterase